MIRILFIFLILIFCFSCEEQGLFVKCPDCLEEEPVFANIEIKLDINSFGDAILLSVYEGNLEDSILYNTYLSYGSSKTISLSINKKYTFTASYYRQGNNYITVDSATPNVKYTKNQCDVPCYFVYDRYIDLRLKHTK